MKPIGLYASEICTVDMWKTLSEDNLYSLCEKFDVEKVHIKFLKSALGVHRKACNSAVRGELGSLPLLLHSVKPIIKYLYRLKRLPADCLAYKSFLECKTSLLRPTIRMTFQSLCVMNTTVLVTCSNLFPTNLTGCMSKNGLV